jgi:hypothetical protein
MLVSFVIVWFGGLGRSLEKVGKRRRNTGDVKDASILGLVVDISLVTNYHKAEQQQLSFLLYS